MLVNTQFLEGDERGIDSQRQFDGQFGRYDRSQNERAFQEQLVLAAFFILTSWKNLMILKKNE